jgi:hypothetical protein
MLFGPDDLARVRARSVPPLGIFQLVRLEV